MATLPTAIVLAVVQCGDRICVGRRSRRVATARGLWSVVTGYVEPNVDPLAQALEEIHEELGLSPPGLALVCDMEAVSLSSPTSGKQFLVYPFLFECSGTDQVVLNWEHDEFDWVEPSRLEAPDCVQWQPPLVRALLAAGQRAHRQ